MGTTMETTQQPVTVGRVVHVYSTVWAGPRPGIVVDAGEGGRCTVNVFADGVRDRSYLAALRRAETGNTFRDVPVYDGIPAGAMHTDGEHPTPRFLCDEGVRCTIAGDYELHLLAVWPPRA